MHNTHRKKRAVIGLVFVVCQLLIFSNLDSISTILSTVEDPTFKQLVFGIFIFGLGPLMSIEMICHYDWAINLELIILLTVSWVPAILIFMGFFIISNKKYIYPLILGLLMWPVVGFFWVAMGA